MNGVKSSVVLAYNQSSNGIFGASTAGINLGPSCTLSVNLSGGDSDTFAGYISGGGGGLTVSGGGTLILTGNNTFTGTTTIGMGTTLQLGNGNSTGTLPGSSSSEILDYGTLALDPASGGSLTLQSNFSGGGLLLIGSPSGGNATVTFSGNSGGFIWMASWAMRRISRSVAAAIGR